MKFLLCSLVFLPLSSDNTCVNTIGVSSHLMKLRSRPHKDRYGNCARYLFVLFSFTRLKKNFRNCFSLKQEVKFFILASSKKS